MRLILYVLMLSPATYFLIHGYRTSKDFRDTVKILATIALHLAFGLMTLIGVLGTLMETGVIKQ